MKRKILEKPNQLETVERLSEAESTESSASACSVYEAPVELESKCQNRYSYDHLAIVSDRYRISSRATAAIVNAALQDMGILSDENTPDRKKVGREKVRVGDKNVLFGKKENVGIFYLGFDG